MLWKTSLLLAVLPRWLLLEVARLNPHKKHEAKAEPDVAKVAVDVVECFEYPPRPGAAVVEVAGFRVAFNGEEDKLERGDAVEDNEEGDDVVVGVRAEVTMERVAEEVSEKFWQSLSASSS